MSAVPSPSNLSSMMAKMSDQQLQQFASMHREDPYTFPLAFAESNRRKQMRVNPQQQGEQPPVVDQALTEMGDQPPPPPQMGDLPEDTGIATLPAPNMQHMADGGIVAFARGGDAGEGQSDPLEFALQAEGVNDPKQQAFLRAIYGQESGGGKNTTTSNRGAKGGMQVTDIAFKDVPHDDLDKDNKYDLARAGVRYGLKGLAAANGDAVLAGVHYYGGPSAMKDAAEGVSRKDKKNPNAPDTLAYGQQIAKRMAALLPISSAEAAPAAPADDGKGLNAPWWSREYARAANADERGGLELELLRREKAKKEGIPADDWAQSIIKHGVASSDQPTNLPSSQKLGAKPAFHQPMHPSSQIDPNQPEPTEEAPAPVQQAEEKPESGGFNMSQNDWLRLGLGLLGSKERHWQHALGGAGEQVLAGRDKDAAAKLAAQKATQEAKYYKDMGFYHRAQGNALLNDDRGMDAFMKQLDTNAEKDIASDMSLIGKPKEVRAAAKQRYIQAALAEWRKNQLSRVASNPPEALSKYMPAS